MILFLLLLLLLLLLPCSPSSSPPLPLPFPPRTRLHRYIPSLTISHHGGPWIYTDIDIKRSSGGRFFKYVHLSSPTHATLSKPLTLSSRPSSSPPAPLRRLDVRSFPLSPLPPSPFPPPCPASDRSSTLLGRRLPRRHRIRGPHRQDLDGGWWRAAGDAAGRT